MNQTTFLATVLALSSISLLGCGVEPGAETDESAQSLATPQVPCKGIDEDYAWMGGASSFGAPIGAVQTTVDGKGHFRNYANGSIYQLGCAYSVMGAIRDHYAGLGAQGGLLGYPLNDPSTAVDGARYSPFQYGMIFYTAATGAHEIHGDIRNKWYALNPTGAYGYPTTDEKLAPGGGGRYNDFQRGSIYWNEYIGPRGVQGAIRDKYLSLGGTQGWLGFPLTDETGAVPSAIPPVNGWGRYNNFQGGSIYWNSAPGGGAWSIRGIIRDTWLGLGGGNSPLGYPASDEMDSTDGKAKLSRFQFGTICWPLNGVAKVEPIGASCNVSVPVCTPLTCSGRCGTVYDGCGHTLNCSACVSCGQQVSGACCPGNTCNGGMVCHSGLCGFPCSVSGDACCYNSTDGYYCKAPSGVGIVTCFGACE